MRFQGIAAGLGALAAALVWAAPASVGAAQGQDQAPQVFRASANLVEVDVMVHDSDNRFVAGLTRDDFEIFEDGEPQRVEQFYLVAHEGGSVRAVNPLDSTPDLTDARNRRLFVFLFDERHLSTESLLRIKTGVERFINTQFRTGDYGGIYSAGAMYRGRITADKIELLAGLQQVQPSIDNRERLLQELRSFPAIPGEHEALRIDYGDQSLLDGLAAELCENDPQACQIAGGEGQVEFQIEQKARQYIREARVATASTIEQLRHVAVNLGTIPGRKTVVFLSDGFFIEENRADVQAISALAARSGATFYSVYGRVTSIVGGHPTPDALSPERGRLATFDSVDDGPQILTGTTGGFVVRNANDISGAIGLVARDTSTYYVLGYQPTNGQMDGKLRRIEVRAKSEGMRVRARKGYVASPLPQVNARGGGGGR